MLTRLELTNFRCFKHQVFDFTAPRTLILGENDRGKSTLLDAVRWLTTGRCRGLDDGGKGVAVLVRDVYEKGDTDAGGKRQMSVSATIVKGDDQRVITRTFNGVTSGFTMSGAQGQSADQEAAFFAWLGAGRRQLQVVLDGQLFADLAHADAKDLLTAFLPVEVEDPLNPGTMLSPQDVERLYDAAVATRRDAKRDLAKVPEPTEPPAPVGDLEGVRARLAEIEAEHGRLTIQRAESAGASAGKAQADLEAANRQVLELKSQWQRALTRYQLDLLKVADLDQQIAAAQKEVDNDTADVARLETVLANLPPVGDGLPQVQADTLDAHDPKSGCVLCADVPCKTPKAAFVKQATVLAAVAARTKDARAEIAKAVSDLRDAKEIAETNQETLDKLTAVRPTFEAIETALAELEATLPALKAAAEAKPEPSELDNQISVLVGRIQKGKAIVESKQALQRQHAAYDLAVASRLELRTKVDLAEAAVKAYGPGPGGLVSKAVASVLADFSGCVNATLEHFGYEFSVSLDPWALVINGRRWELLAESVKYRASIALQIAFANLVGVDFTLIDRLDVLTQPNRRVATQLVLSSTLGQILIAKSEENETGSPNIAGVQVVRL